jgi:hypothetical protein
MGKIRFRIKGASPNDPLFITLFPDPDDGSVTVVEPPVMVELEAKDRQQIYANCIAALEKMTQNVSPQAPKHIP